MQQVPDQQLFVFQDACIRTTIDLGVYRLSALQKTAYRLADRCTVVIGSVDGAIVPVSLAFPSGTGEEDAKSVARLFFQELLDQELREQIGSETGAIRSLILAHAFSKTDLVNRG
jgi:His-Xaa-Ser system protein HxsD